MSEPSIIINGQVLTEGQAMAVRVAITEFHAETADMHALGTDQDGMKLCTAYHLRLSEVVKMIVP